MKIDISEVQICFIKPKDGLIGFASLVLNKQIYLGSIGIHRKLNKDEYRLTYPTKKLGDGTQNIFHPINRETSFAIEKAVIEKLKNVMNNDRHHSNNNERRL